MIERIDYRTLSINGKTIVLPKRVNEIELFTKHNCFVILLASKKDDPECGVAIKENVHCYDFEGNLKWIYPWGITGMGKIDENTVDLYDGSYSNHVRVSTGDTIRSEFVK
jgi:hypothetical protein